MKTKDENIIDVEAKEETVEVEEKRKLKFADKIRGLKTWQKIIIGLILGIGLSAFTETIIKAFASNPDVVETVVDSVVEDGVKTVEF